MTVTYGIGKLVAAPFAETLERTRVALRDEGFGVLCDIDVAATLRAKLDVETGDYVILGACNPRLAHRALQAERELGLLLPCNVIVYAAEAGTRVSAIDPEIMLGMIDNPVLAEVAREVRTRLTRVIDRL
jgi:uncharacterized protein (DUF302 family)